MDITLEMVANQVNISRSHFARQFRQHTGFSVIEYLLKVRCDAVAKLLASSDTDITAVAFATGFSNLSHLYRHFKRRYGITPGAFRQMIKNQGATLTTPPNE
jgi:AraC-like DNA-binding protein